MNENILDEIPLEKRLLFKMGGTLDGYIACHQKLSRLFASEGDKGVDVVKIADFGKD